MKNLVESIHKLAEVKADWVIVDQFARDCFNKKFPGPYPANTWKAYNSFDIISEGKIRVNYSHGWGDMEDEESFIVEIQ